MFKNFGSYFLILIVAIILSAGDTLQQNPFQCGIPRVNTTKLEQNGQDTEPGAWPWHAALYHKKNGGDHYACGGTLISEKFVLTAAHCLFDTGNGRQLVNNRIFVRLGVHDLDELDSKSLQQYRINKIHRHPNQNGGKVLRNDIAILELETMAQLNDYVQPACLSVSKDLKGNFGTAIGWGFTASGEFSTPQRSVLMSVVDTNTCLNDDRNLFGGTLDNGIFCAEYLNDTGVCNGDTGSGIFFKVDNAWHLGGIKSYGRSRDANSNLCHSDSYGVFTKVNTYLPWISSVTQLKFQENEEPAHELGSGMCNAKDVDPSKTYTNHSLPLDCGVYVTNRIARGRKTDVFDFPWMAIISNGSLFCQGTLISKRYILTSAGCSKEKDKEYAIILGDHTRHQDRDCNVKDGQIDCAPPTRVYGIECVVAHQSYDSKTGLYNIALIRSDRDIQFETHIQPICLPVTNALRKFFPEKYIMTGWGRASEKGKLSKKLLKGIVTTADRSECQRAVNEFDRVLDHSQLCVGSRNESSLCGDSGTPLGNSAWYNGMRFVQFGIASYGAKSCNGFSIFTNVAYYMDWIHANMEP